MKKIFFVVIATMLVTSAVIAQQSLEFTNITWGQQSGGQGYRANLKNNSASPLTVNMQNEYRKWGNTTQGTAYWLILGLGNTKQYVLSSYGTENYTITIPANGTVEFIHFVQDSSGIPLTVGPQGSGNYAATILSILPGNGYSAYPTPSIWAEYNRNY